MSDENRVHIEPAGLGAEERQTSAEGSGAWRPWSEVPAPMRRIIALYDDGSGARMYFHAEDGQLFDGEDGCEYEWLQRDDMWVWAYLPPGFRLWVEDCNDPMTFPDASRSEVTASEGEVSPGTNSNLLLKDPS